MESLVFKMISIHFMLPGFPPLLTLLFLFRRAMVTPFGEFFRVLWTRHGSSMCLCDHLCHGILQPGQLHSTQEVPDFGVLSFLQILSSRSTLWILHFTCALFLSTHFFWKSPQPTSTHSHQTLFGETAKNGDHQMVLILGKSKNANGYGKFEGCPPLKHVHCLGWCQKMTTEKLTWQWETSHEWVDASPNWKLGDVPLSHVAFEWSWLST